MSSILGKDPARLNGWKEIALHLGKGTRTVQRWEKLYGLPVHRIGREGGEIVYAFRDEIDRWMAATEEERSENGDEPAGEAGVGPPPAAPDRGRRWATALVLLAATAGAIGSVSLLHRPPGPGDPAGPSHPGRQPAGWRLANESLTVFDATGALLFEHRFGFRLSGAFTSDSPEAEVGPSRVLVADVDGDGRSEILVNANAADRANRRLYVFEPDGRVRFVHQPTGTRRYGEDDYSEPWLAHRVFVTRGPDGARRLWAVFTHSLLFPAVVRELDPRDGTVRQEYWSDGYVEVVHEETWAGRPVVFVGGTNNDFRAASLAVFPPNGVMGSTPAVRPGYACRDCPPGGPERLFLFPTLCIARGRGQAGIYETWVEKGDRIRVSVAQGGATPAETTSYYTLGPDGALLSAEMSREFQAAHARLERAGTLDHPFGPQDDRDMFPVVRWDGRRFVDLPRVPVHH